MHLKMEGLLESLASRLEVVRMRQGMQIPFSANLSFSTKFPNMGTLRTNHDAWEFVHSRIHTRHEQLECR